MKRQISVEIRKLFYSVPVLVVFSFFALMGVANSIIKFVPNDLTGYQSYISVLTDTSLIFLLSLVVSIFIASDFNDRTIQNELKLGYSRKSVVLCRAIVILPVTAIIHFIYAVISAIPASIAAGFAAEASITALILWSLLILLKVIAIQSVVVFIVFLFRKLTSSIAVSVCAMVVLCNIMRNFIISESWASFFEKTCFSLEINMLTSTLSDMLISVALALITIAIFATGAVAAFKKVEVE